MPEPQTPLSPSSQQPAAEMLVVYYSRSGRTRLLAQLIAAALGADVEEIKERKDRGGPVGYMTAGKDTLLNRPSELTSRHSVEGRRIVIIGMPVWAWHVPPPIRAYLDAVDLAGKTVYAFCTHGGGGGKGTFKELSERIGLAGTMEWKEPKANDPALQKAVGEFCAKIR